MKNVLLVLFVCFFATASFSQESKENNAPKEEEKRKILLQVNTQDELKAPDTQIQEQIEVGAEEFPGLNVSFDNPADSIKAYKPYTKKELQAYSDLLLDYKLTDFDRTETARPHKPARLFQVRVPDE